MYMDDIKLCAKNERELETRTQILRIYSQDMGRNLAEKMHHASNEKRKTTHERRERFTKPRKKKQSGKRKRTNTFKYWKLTPSNKKR